MGFAVDDAKLKRAGLDYWHYLDITYYDSLADFMACAKGEMFFFTTKGRRRYTDAVYPNGCYLLFGREDAGLPEDLLKDHEPTCLRIPMAGGLRSLNLSNAVAVAVYEALRQWDFPALQNEGQLTKFKWEGNNIHG